MRTDRTIHVVSCHAEGEVGDVIVGGVAPPPGETIWEQSRWIARDNELRDFVLNEPRGGVFRHVNLLVPPKHERADAAFIVMEPVHTPPMSGSNAMCVTTVLLETGIVPMVEPMTKLCLEAPGGLVDVVARCEGGRVLDVTIRNVASFAAALDQRLEVEGVGSIVVDTAYGGDSFVMVRAGDLGFALTPDEASDLARVGAMITKAANEQLGFEHPELPEWRHISFCQISAVPERMNGRVRARNAVAIDPGKVDRSPTGTGVSARLAVLRARGEIDVGEELEVESILGSTFTGRIESLVSIGTKPGVLPSVTGRAWITGMHQHMLDPSDPWPRGYRLSDTWPAMGSRDDIRG